MGFKSRKSHKRARKGKARKGPARRWKKSHGLRKQARNKNVAVVTETLDYEDKIAMKTQVHGSSAELHTVALNEFERCTSVSVNFRFFRIAKVTYEYQAEANTFQADVGTASTIPYMYHAMCRDGSYNGTASTTAGTLGDLLDMGAKPIPFTKMKKISYVPNVCLNTGMLASNGSLSSSSFVTRKKSPWLSTGINGTGTPPVSGAVIPHFGHQMGVYADSFQSGALAYSCRVTIEVHFKGPVGLGTISAPAIP